MRKKRQQHEVAGNRAGLELSRRNFLTSTGIIAAGGVLAAGSGLLMLREAEATSSSTPPLPWQYTRLDPAEAGRRGYKFYLEKGG